MSSSSTPGTPPWNSANAPTATSEDDPYRDRFFDGGGDFHDDETQHEWGFDLVDDPIRKQDNRIAANEGREWEDEEWNDEEVWNADGLAECFWCGRTIHSLRDRWFEIVASERDEMPVACGADCPARPGLSAARRLGLAHYELVTSF